jgi:hypothetical protein
MSPEIVAAIIGGIAVVLSAVIAGIFKLKERGEEDKQSAQAGGHVIQARDNVAQNINIVEKAQSRNYQKYDLLEVVSEIKEYANTILIENQKTLRPLFSKKPTRNEVKESLEILFNEQHGRANFGEWQGYLTNALEKKEYQPAKYMIVELLSLLEQLHASLYSYYSSSDFRLNNYETMKHYMVVSIENDNVSIEQLRLSAKDYLEFLRSLIEKIGVINGKLKFLSELEKRT